MMPQAALMIGSRSSVPIHTAVESCGVYPTIQASELLTSSRPCVPVLTATSRPPSRLRRE